MRDLLKNGDHDTILYIWVGLVIILIIYGVIFDGFKIRRNSKKEKN